MNTELLAELHDMVEECTTYGSNQKMSGMKLCLDEWQKGLSYDDGQKLTFSDEKSSSDFGFSSDVESDAFEFGYFELALVIIKREGKEISQEELDSRG